ncbi:hypothetical protein I3760_06G100700 [Carya illinoinensis]|nr:hypothetical protein I3760_06G100700 [Carya illinoinensis]
MVVLGQKRAILDGVFTIYLAQLSKYLLNESNPLGSFRLAKLRSISEEGKSLQLQFLAEDLGFSQIISTLDLVCGEKVEFLSDFGTS